MDNLQSNQKVLKVSRISKLSLILLLFGIALYIALFLISNTGLISNDKKQILTLVTLAIWVCAFILGIIDICKKDRIKVLSIITIVMSGIPVAFFILILVTMVII